jgi:hypothetical protein
MTIAYFQFIAPKTNHFCILSACQHVLFAMVYSYFNESIGLMCAVFNEWKATFASEMISAGKVMTMKSV